MLNLDEVASQKLAVIGSFFSGSPATKIAVLGAFDTWPYMDFIATLLAESNYIAVTSRWLYRKSGNKVLRFDIKEHSDYASKGFMSTLLDQIITGCEHAIINFSVSAAHFIEADWCFQKSKKTLGIAYVRSAIEPFESPCTHLSLKTTPMGMYSECTAKSERTAWHCIREHGFCPFNRQNISKNVVEYFFRSQQMKLIAVENLKILPYILESEFPPLSAKSEGKISKLSDDIIAAHEFLFRINAILTILILDNLLRRNMFVRASKLKLLTLAETMPRVNINKIATSTAIKSTGYMRNIRKGYVDLQNVKDSCGTHWLDGCICELERLGILERITLNYKSDQEAQLLRLTNKGKIFAKFLCEEL